MLVNWLCWPKPHPMEPTNHYSRSGRSTICNVSRKLRQFTAQRSPAVHSHTAKDQKQYPDSTEELRLKFQKPRTTA
eukprot:5584348-Amphidinium_carterae.1